MLFMILLGWVVAPSALATQSIEPASRNEGAVVPAFEIPDSEADKECPRAVPRIAVQPPRGARFRRLDELPPGRLELTVLREIDGCAIPAIVHEGIGGSSVPENDDRR